MTMRRRRRRRGDGGLVLGELRLGWVILLACKELIGLQSFFTLNVLFSIPNMWSTPDRTMNDLDGDGR